MKTFSEWLVANGYDEAQLSDSQKKHLKHAYEAEQQPAPKPPEPQDKKTKEASPAAVTYEEEVERDRREANRQIRIRDITRNATSHAAKMGNVDQIDRFDNICKTAITDGWSLQKFELEMLREERNVGPIIITPQTPQVSDDVIEAAICRMGKLSNLEDEFDDKTLSAVDKRFKHGIGLHELVGLCASQNGWRGNPGSIKQNLRSALEAAFGHGGYGSFGNVPSNVLPSTLSISGILSNTANKFLRNSWNAVESTWRQITSVRSVNDFKQITSYSLTGDLTYKAIPAGGEIKHGTLGNETYTNQAQSYGLLIGLDRRDLINDDLGALTSVSKRLGRGGALKLNEVFWTEFLADHSTFFPTDASLLNYDAGTDTAFSADGLTAADVFWKAKTDPDGKPLGLMAKLLLVPPAHRIPALRLMSSQTSAKDSDLGINNPHAGAYTVVSSVYLANSNMGGGYSSLAWYMLADPEELSTIETCFLNGVETPTVEQVELAADHLGMAMRAYHDFGVNKQEYRAALKLKGEA